VDVSNQYEVIVGFYSEEQASEGFKFKDAVGLGSANGEFGEVKSGGIGMRTPAYQKANKTLRKQILLHEFGHVLGLDHVSKKNELMSVQVDGSKTTFNKETKEYFLSNPGCVK
jgi:predicted Zn-dependent protease